MTSLDKSDYGAGMAQNRSGCASCARGATNPTGCASCARGGAQAGSVQTAGYQNVGGDLDPNGPTVKGPPPGLIAMGPNMDPGPVPRELIMASHPPYTVAPPDILFIDCLRMIPRPPYHIEALEVLLITVSDTLPNQPITGQYTVSPEGTISLGFGYGSVRVTGLTLDQAQEAIRRHLSSILRNPQVSLALAQFRGMQLVRGTHLVRPDGTVSLGTFGSVYVAGMTMGQVKCVIEKHLANYILDPQVSVDVAAYNSKVYYLIYDGGGYGQQVFRMPITGNETVLDAIGKAQGLAPVSSTRKIWVARPTPGNLGYRNIMPVDWHAITQAGATDTNYELFPGDRVYVQANCLITINNRVAQVLAPINQIMGSIFLGTTTASSFSGTGSAALLIGR